MDITLPVRQTSKFSRSFQGTFGNYGSLQYLDIVVEEQNLDPKRITQINKLFETTMTFTREISLIENNSFRDIVKHLVRAQLLERHGSYAFRGKLYSLTRNFIITKFKEIG